MPWRAGLCLIPPRRGALDRIFSVVARNELAWLDFCSFNGADPVRASGKTRECPSKAMRAVEW